MSLVSNDVGGYRFLAAEGRPFSAGLVANRGYNLTHLTFRRPRPLEDGISFAVDHLKTLGRPPQAIAGFELRIPAPLTSAEFDEFNKRYIEHLRRAGVLVRGLVPAARTNVAPVGVDLIEPVLHAVSYSVPSTEPTPAYLLSGIAEDKPGDALAMADAIWISLADRLTQLGVTLGDASVLQLYCASPLENIVAEHFLARVGGARRFGIHWFPSLPPIVGLNLEIDVRSMANERFA